MKKTGLIYVEQISERIRYVEQNFFKERLIDIRFTNDKQEFTAFEGAKLNYSNLELKSVFHLKPSQLLFDEKIVPVEVKREDWNNAPCIQFNGIQDPLATLFYCVSRYEEYLPFNADNHGRYLASNSILFQEFDFQEQVVERCFFAFLEQYFPEFFSTYQSAIQSEIIPSFDIDNTFAFKWKEGWRTWLSLAKDRLNNNKKRIEQRRKVQCGDEKDPYDSFDEIKEVLRKYRSSKVFWLLGDFKKYDKNITWSDPRHQRLIRELDQLVKLGLHPGYASNIEPKRLTAEKDRLTKILDREILDSRQHFLKLSFPQTYRGLVENGFKNDYSMGYAEQPGFRAGTAHPFLWFDLQQNCTTDLTIYPFAYMDGTFNQYLKLSTDQAITEVKQLILEVKKYGGVFSFIWHNETFAESGEWKGWRTVFDATLSLWDGKE